jgi:hypothetical protein
MQKGDLGIRRPVGTPVALDTSVTSITNSAYVQLVASTTAPCSGISVTNTGAQPIYFATGAAGSEVNQFIIAPGGVIPEVLPFEIAKGTRIALKAAGGSTQSSGIIALSFFG